MQVPVRQWQRGPPPRPSRPSTSLGLDITGFSLTEGEKETGTGPLFEVDLLLEDETAELLYDPAPQDYQVCMPCRLMWPAHPIESCLRCPPPTTLMLMHARAHTHTHTPSLPPHPLPTPTQEQITEIMQGYVTTACTITRLYGDPIVLRAVMEEEGATVEPGTELQELIVNEDFDLLVRVGERRSSYNAVQELIVNEELDLALLARACVWAKRLPVKQALPELLPSVLWSKHGAH